MSLQKAKVVIVNADVVSKLRYMFECRLVPTVRRGSLQVVTVLFCAIVILHIRLGGLKVHKCAWWPNSHICLTCMVLLVVSWIFSPAWPLFLPILLFFPLSPTPSHLPPMEFLVLGGLEPPASTPDLLLDEKLFLYQGFDHAKAKVANTLLSPGPKGAVNHRDVDLLFIRKRVNSSYSFS